MQPKKKMPEDKSGKSDQNVDWQLDYKDFTPDHPEIHAIIFRHAAKRAVLRDIEKEIYRETGNSDFAALCSTMLGIKFKQMGGCYA